MPNYRRAYIAGGTVFLTWFTHNRKPLFTDADNITLLRQAVRQAKTEAPFEIIAAVVLPDHIHFVWSIPPHDSNYSQRVGRIKVLFTRSFKGQETQPASLSPSRRKHRESDV
jgi:putative transposase